MKTLNTIFAVCVLAIGLAMPAGAQSIQKRVTALALVVPDYTAEMARADTAFYITNLDDLEESYREIIDFITTASQQLHTTSIQIRASNGVVDRNSENWLVIRARLQQLGYEIRVNNRNQTAEIGWE